MIITFLPNASTGNRQLDHNFEFPSAIRMMSDVKRNDTAMSGADSSEYAGEFEDGVDCGIRFARTRDEQAFFPDKALKKSSITMSRMKKGQNRKNRSHFKSRT